MKNKVENGLDFKEFFKAIYSYKFSILIITLLSVIVAFLFQYYQQNIYKAKAVLEIANAGQSVNLANGDILNSAFGNNFSNIKTEIEKIKSISVTKRALKKVDLAHEYYAYLEYRDSGSLSLIGKIKNIFGKYKKVDIYNDTPFKLEVKNGDDIPFIVKPIDKNRFRLIVKNAYSKNGDRFSYDSVHKYSENINNKYFSIKIIKLKEPLYKKYILLKNNPNTLAKNIVKGLNVLRTEQNSNAIKIEYEDTTPQRAQKYVNAVADAYIEQNIEFKTQEATKKLEFINKQLAQITGSLQESTGKLEDFQTKQNFVDANQKVNQLIKNSSSISSSLQQLKLQREILQSLYNQVKNGDDIDSIAIVGFDSKNSPLIDMITRLQQAIVERKSLLETYTIHHPEVIKYTRVINQLKRSISKTLQTSLRVLNKKIAYNQQLLQREDAELSSLPKKERIFSNLKRDYLVNEKIYNYLLEKKSEITLIKESTISNNRVIDYATLQTKPIKPKRLLIVVLGFILGLGLGIIYAYIKNLSSTRVVDEYDIEHLAQENISAHIPHLKALKIGEVAVYKNLKSDFTEAFRNLRTELRFLINDNKKSHIFMVTSTQKDDGKSTVAVNLAAILGLSSKSVVLVDLNLREPILHKFAHVSNTIGVTNYLNAETSFIKIVQTNIFKNVDIITSGSSSNIPSELIDSQRFKDFIEKLKSYYDYIIFDTASIEKYSETKIISSYSDLAIHIVRANHTKKENLISLENLYKKLNKRFTIVLNDSSKIVKD